LVRHFWHWWLEEWLPSLQSTRKWNKEANNIKIGDVVLVIKPDEKRGEWPIGRVEKTYQGDDGKVRVIDVIVKRKVYKRSIKNIILLQKDDNQWHGRYKLYRGEENVSKKSHYCKILFRCNTSLGFFVASFILVSWGFSLHSNYIQCSNYVFNYSF